MKKSVLKVLVVLVLIGLAITYFKVSSKHTTTEVEEVEIDPQQVEADIMRKESDSLLMVIDSIMIKLDNIASLENELDENIRKNIELRKAN